MQYDADHAVQLAQSYFALEVYFYLQLFLNHDRVSFHGELSVLIEARLVAVPQKRKCLRAVLDTATNNLFNFILPSIDISLLIKCFCFYLTLSISDSIQTVIKSRLPLKQVQCNIKLTLHAIYCILYIYN